MSVESRAVTTIIPARLDRLPWSRWHWLIVISLGTVWILDGLEVTIKGAVGASLVDSIGFSTVQVAGSASVYLFGAISGALVWGYLTDRFGRQLMFILTLGTYMVGVIGTTLAGLVEFGPVTPYVWFAFFRFITGFGIGGEYAAVNSAIDELMPARVRGWVALSINGSYWAGTIVGASLGFVFLQTLPSDLAWRVAFGLGAFLGIGILLLRLYVPESPRWLMTHGREEEAEETMREIEQKVIDYEDDLDELEQPSENEEIELRERGSIGYLTLARTVFGLYPRRAFAGFSLLVTQAFLYNAIFFTYGLMLTTFFDVDPLMIPLFLIPFAVGNFLGPLILGRYFDTLGRKVMIPATFWLSGALTLLTGFLFWQESIGSAVTMTIAWVAIFFFASAGASAGYLTISETFPLEIRAMAIAFFYAIGTAVGGIAGPYLYGNLIATETRLSMFYGYIVAAVLMFLGGLMHRIFGVEAAGKSLEEVAMPLSRAEAREKKRSVQLNGPLGLDPAFESSIREFQSEHDLEVDGIIGPKTMGAIRALLESDPEAERGDDLGLDVTDADSVRAFQERFGLEPSGTIGPATRGALKAHHVLLGVDPGNADSIRRFQRDFALPEDGIIGRETQTAMRAVAAERGTYGRDELDVADPAQVRLVQESLGISPSGSIDDETRGALSVLRHEQELALGLDVTDPDAVRAFQERSGVEATGIVDEPTQRAFRQAYESRRRTEDEVAAADRARPLLDPTEPASIRRFQREHGLEEDGIVGPETQELLREERHRTLGVDAGDPDSIRAFQAEHGLEADGVIGPETQGAMDALRSALDAPDEVTEEERERDDDDVDAEADDEEETDEVFVLDIADPASVRRFQREHGLAADGVIGPLTQVAIRVIQIERDRTGRLGEDWAQRREERRAREEREGRPYPQHAVYSGFAYVPLYPDRDRELDGEIEAIVGLLEEESDGLSEREARERLHARRWGPGRFSRATRLAQEQGRLRRNGRRLERVER